MKTRIITIIILVFTGFGYAQQSVLTQGRASWSFFGSDVVLGLELKNNQIDKIIFSEKDATDKDDMRGIFDLKELTQFLHKNQMKFNSETVQEILRVNVGPNFSNEKGGLIFVSVFVEDNWSDVYVFHIKKRSGIFKIFYQDQSKNNTELAIIFIDFNLGIFPKRIKKCRIETFDGTYQIFPIFKKE